MQHMHQRETRLTRNSVKCRSVLPVDDGEISKAQRSVVTKTKIELRARNFPGHILQVRQKAGQRLEAVESKRIAHTDGQSRMPKQTDQPQVAKGLGIFRG